MEQCSEVFVGIDVAKMRNAIAVADGERGGEVRYLGEIDAAPESMRRLVKRLAAKHARLHFCYEAGPTGYGVGTQNGPRYTLRFCRAFDGAHLAKRSERGGWRIGIGPEVIAGEIDMLPTER